MVITRSLTSLLGEDQADPRLVGSGFTVGRVVQLEHDVAAGLDQFGLSGFALGGRQTRGVPNQQLGGNGSAAFGCFCLAATLLGDERNPGLGVLQPTGSGRTNETR